MAKLVSKTYGEALFEIAMEENKADQLLHEVESLFVILKENKDFDKFMKHPGIAKQDKIEMFQKVFQGRISREMEGFLKIIITKERYNDILDIFQYFIDKMKEEKRIGTAYVTTAVALDEIQKANVKENLLNTTAYKQMDVQYFVDASLIGGMIIRIKDRVVDSSIRSQLENMTKQLLQIQLEASN